jgi:glycosyltransferase 2 family protein
MKKRVHTAVIVALSLGLLALFLRGAHLSEVWSEIKDANAWLIGISVGMTVVNMVVRAIRWQYLLAPVGEVGFRPSFRTTMIGFAANTVLPARAGEVIRPYLLARQEGLSGTAAFATIVVERLLDGVTVVLLLAAFVLFFASGMPANNAVYRAVRLGGLLVGAGTVFILGVMFFAAGDPQALGRWAFKLEHLLPGRATHMLAELLQRFAEGLAVVRAPIRLLVALALSFPLWLSIALGIWTVTSAFHIAMPFTGSFLLMAVMVVGVAVPTPGGVGAFEAVTRIGLTSFWGVANDRAVGAALVLHATSILPTVALGFLFLIQDGLDFSGVRKLAHAAAEGDAE